MCYAEPKHPLGWRFGGYPVINEQNVTTRSFQQTKTSEHKVGLTFLNHSGQFEGKLAPFLDCHPTSKELTCQPLKTED